MGEVAKVLVGPASSFLAAQQARQVVKVGTRNILVLYHQGHFYALDNACYHHGGPLLTGDIEDMGGHTCIVCPWHRYSIALDTGEGLYLGLDMGKMSTNGSSSSKGRPAMVPKVCSKGRKQRVHTVLVEDGQVYVVVDLRGPALESDHYADMAIANHEEAMSRPVAFGDAAGAHVSRSALHSSYPGAVPQHRSSGEVFQGTRAPRRGNGTLDAMVAAGRNPLQTMAKAWSDGAAVGVQSVSDTTPADGAKGEKRDALMVSCCAMRPVCTGVKELHFCLHAGSLHRRIELGQHVELELPLCLPGRATVKRSYTVCDTDTACGGLFMVLVKSKAERSRESDKEGAGGTAVGQDGGTWLQTYALHKPLRLCRVWGDMTMTHYEAALRRVGGQVLWLTAGIGLTSAYAAVKQSYDNLPFTQAAGTPLHILHLHVDRGRDRVAKLVELVDWTRCFAMRGRQSSYALRCFFTREAAVAAAAEGDGGGVVARGRGRAGGMTHVVYGRRPSAADIRGALEEEFGSANDCVAFVSGPDGFVRDCRAALQACGVPAASIVTAEDDTHDAM